MTDSNSPSGFWHLPTELRWAIYDHLDHSRVIHVSQRNGRAVLHDCATTSVSNNDDGRERYPLPHFYHHLWEPLVDGQAGRNQAWARRLRSAWGPHWQCDEELSEGTDPKDTDLRVLRRVCKQMNQDIRSYMIQAYSLYVADLGLLEDMCDGRVSVPRFAEMRRMHVHLRLPLLALKALDVTIGDHNPAPEASALAARWARVWPSIANLESIINVKIEIDHMDPGSWSLVNERAILAPIKVMCSAVPHLATTVILPKLHPRYENPLRHFTGGESEPFAILRRVRQKFHYQDRPYGGWQIACSRYDTFPLAVDLVVWRTEIIWVFGQPPDRVTPEEREAFVQEELDKWKQGVDVAAWADELNRDVPDEMLCG